MNIYTFDIFTNHCIAVEEIYETDKIGFHLHHLEIGPLYLPESSHLKIVKEDILNISSLSILIMGRLLWTSANRNKTSNTLSSAFGKWRLCKSREWNLNL